MSKDARADRETVRDEAQMTQSQAWRPARVIVIGVAAVAAIQLFFLFRSNVIPLSLRVWNHRKLTPKERSAALAFGSDFAGFMRFTAEIVPADGKLVLPRAAQDSTLGNIGLMQYFLIPRELINCPSSEPAEEEACVSRLSGADTYFLASGSFPPASAAEKSKTLIPFNSKWGVYAPSPR